MNSSCCLCNKVFEEKEKRFNPYPLRSCKLHCCVKCYERVKKQIKQRDDFHRTLIPFI